MVEDGESQWRNLERKFGFTKVISSFVKCIIQGVFVGHHNLTITISYITKSGIVRGKSRTKQTLSDAWEATSWKVLCQGSHTVITEIRLTKKFITDEGGAGPLLPRMLVEKLPEVERRRLYVLSADIEAH